MKILFVISVTVGCLHSLCSALPALDHGALTGYCDTSDQCAADECCRSFIQPKGRRVVPDSLDTHLMSFGHGRCMKRSLLGQRCVVDELKTGTAGLYYDCPCASGFVCNGTGWVVLNKGQSGVCVSAKSPTATLNQLCSSGSDCADAECCLSNAQIKGKRSINGHCARMGIGGSGCLARMHSGKPSGTVYSCPCVNGLTCHGSGMFVVPLGEMGKCGH